MLFAAILNVVLGDVAGSVRLGVVEAIVGLGLVTAAVRLSAGRRGWWIASFGLLPIVAAVHFWDALVLGSGRLPIVWGIVMPSLALGCLVLPSTRAFFGPRPANSTGPDTHRRPGDARGMDRPVDAQ
ncbi:MAG: hypothetical protein L0Y54_00950 [Sporichthyaceae bacterium]|nr:hypothetical protein [Sporichthyaceae bacterium]